MLKLASLSLVALLALASPSFAKCIAPGRFPDAVKVSGDDLKKLREIAKGLPEQADLVLLLKSAPLAVAFLKGCAVSVGQITVIPISSPTKPGIDGKI